MTAHRVLRLCRTGLFTCALLAIGLSVGWGITGHILPSTIAAAMAPAITCAGVFIDPDKERHQFRKSPPAMRPGLADDCGCTLIYGPGRVDKIRCPGHADPASTELLLEAMNP